jgi:hypothetical protein
VPSPASPMGDRDAALYVDIPHANTQREPSPPTVAFRPPTFRKD